VSDEQQGQGLGSKLLDYVIDIGKDMKLETIYGYVISENNRMIHLCTQRGFQIEPAEEGITKGVLKLS